MSSLLPIKRNNTNTGGRRTEGVPATPTTSYGTAAKPSSSTHHDNSANIYFDPDSNENSDEEYQPLLSLQQQHQPSLHAYQQRPRAGIPTGGVDDNDGSDDEDYIYDPSKYDIMSSLRQSQRHLRSGNDQIMKDLFQGYHKQDYKKYHTFTDSNQNKTHPMYPPIKRFKRHRNFYIYMINEFRHWWKTSRLLVRVSGGYEYCLNNYRTTTMVAVGTGGVAAAASAGAGGAGAIATTPTGNNLWYSLLDTTIKSEHKHHINLKYKAHSRKALKMMKLIGRGGTSKDFLNNVQPFTRTIRIILAVARAVEAHVDNRLYEVGVAEALAFMGNRCSRYIARKLVDTTFQYVVLPITLTQIFDRLPREKWDDDRNILNGDDSDNHYISIDTAITILTMSIMVCGFTRSILPFMFSFLGSAFGRKTTYNTYNAANYRWTSIQHILEFHETSGVYQDTILDEELYSLAKQIATVLGKSNNNAEGDGNNTTTTTTHHERLKEELNFQMVGAGHGGYAVYKKHYIDSQQQNYTIRTTITLHVTPYGPSILNIMPMYIVLERQQYIIEGFDTNEDVLAVLDLAVDPILSAATTPINAVATGYTYNGAFFKSQEWAALVSRYYEELESYNVACRKLGTRKTSSGRKRRQTKGGADGYFTSNYTSTSPPNNLRTLKEFIRSGHIVKRKRKDLKRNKQLMKEVNSMISTISAYQKRDLAPRRIILYLEGLDCSGKSSTAGLICSSLENCGYTVATIQHNRPPTQYQRSQPWMSRCRFEYPNDIIHINNTNDNDSSDDDGTTIEDASGGIVTEGDNTKKNKSEDDDKYMALVWDRGPAGDFVYGKLDELDLHGKLQKYSEFRSYDQNAFYQDNILFFKLLFVSDKDSIASTLGKRLAHVHIVNDLRTWLYSNSNMSESAKDVIDEGLQEIELHIDPTDFIAFNQYESNLSKFTSFARNTEWFMYQGGRTGGGSSSNRGTSDAVAAASGDGDVGEGGDCGGSSPTSGSGYQYYNPWIVINTSKRHPARLGLLKAFRDQLSRYSVAVASSSQRQTRRRRGIFPSTLLSFNRVIIMDKLVAWFKYDRTISQKYSQTSLEQEYIEQRDHGVSVKATFQSLILVGLVLFYANITWKFDLHDYV